MNKVILQKEVQEFLKVYPYSSSRDLALKNQLFPGVRNAELASQIESRQKSKKKLPKWFRTPGIYYPNPLSIEQASSELTAQYKSTLVKGREKLIDLTGGIGVDSYFFSLSVNQVVHCELDQELSAIAAHNLALFKAENISFYAGDGLDYLQGLPDDTEVVVYLDPARRQQNRKVFLLQDCQPDVTRIQKFLFSKVSTLLLKTAPLLDISKALSSLPSTKEVHIISLKNECKELLFVLEKAYKGPVTLLAKSLTEGGEFEFSFSPEQEKEAVVSIGFPIENDYLYDPDAALLKAGCFKLLSERLGLDKIQLNTHLYFSSRPVHDFPGRIFRIIQIQTYGEFKKDKKNWSASIVSKNFPLKAEELRKRHKISESNSHFLFFCRDDKNKLQVLFTERITRESPSH